MGLILPPGNLPTYALELEPLFEIPKLPRYGCSHLDSRDECPEGI
jgi:hypothetical protein